MQEIHFISVSVLKHINSAIQSNFTQTTICVKGVYGISPIRLVDIYKVKL